MDTPVRRFFDLEWTSHIGTVLRDALDAAASGQGPRVHHFEFNIFEVTIDVERDLVRVQDVLNAAPSGEEVISIRAFSEALHQRQQPHPKTQ